ncbi:MAG TPA: ABC transporter substrate-binding protein [Streptosporangiaceae bacterium]|jgi:ABC-type branched-subunit amino acid transport system substrate-binding protein
MRKPNRWYALAAAVCVCVLTAACGSGGGGKGSGTITIGVLADHAPITAVEGAELQVNTDLAVAQINAAGGVNGHKLAVTYADPKAQADEAINLGQQLVQQHGADVLVGAVLSSECLGVENLAPRLKTVYLASAGCAAEDFTSKQCNRYSFRVSPVGRQGVLSVADYSVKTYGKRWAIIYPDYALGQSQLTAYKAGLKAAGGQLTQIIPIPQNETNMTPYITKIKTGSVDGLVNAEVGADLTRASKAIEQFDINKKLPVVGVFGKERFGGVYPTSLNRDIGVSPELSDSDDPHETAYHKAFRGQLAKESASIVNTLGGTAKAVPGDLGYVAYSTIKALKVAMERSKFTGKDDTDKLITALQSLRVKQGPDSPAGDLIMNPADHQGAQTTYIAKVNGQKEKVLRTIPAAQVPPIGTCKVK